MHKFLLRNYINVQNQNRVLSEKIQATYIQYYISSLRL